MEFLDVVKRRRSVRAYEDRPVPQALLMRILECGHMAPTGGNLQPWEFVVVTDAADRRRLADTTYRGNSYDLAHHQDWIATAPVLIIVAGDRVKASARYGQKSSESLVYLDCSACIENMLLAAVDAGLGACYVSGFFESLIAQGFGLPPSHEVVGIVTLGYEKGSASMRPKEAISGKIHYGRYGGRQE